MPVVFEQHGLTFAYFSTITTLGTPRDAVLQVIRLERFNPAQLQAPLGIRRLALTP